MYHHDYIHTVVASLTSPHWQTRKLVCELLVFLCYYSPEGHQHVIRGFELLQQRNKDLNLFDAWLSSVDRTVDGRGRMGSLVGANNDLKRMGVYNTPDNHLMEYAVSGQTRQPRHSRTHMVYRSSPI